MGNSTFYTPIPIQVFLLHFLSIGSLLVNLLLSSCSRKECKMPATFLNNENAIHIAGKLAPLVLLLFNISFIHRMSGYNADKELTICWNQFVATSPFAATLLPMLFACIDFQIVNSIEQEELLFSYLFCKVPCTLITLYQ